MELAKQLPFCYSQLSGTHNSAITLADGYGNRDLHFQKYLSFIKHVVSVAGHNIAGTFSVKQMQIFLFGCQEKGLYFDANDGLTLPN